MNEQLYTLAELRSAYESGQGHGCAYNKYVVAGWEKYKADLLAVGLVEENPE